MNTTLGSVKLKVSIVGNYIDIDWIYTSNGIDFPGKRVGFSFDQGL